MRRRVLVRMMSTEAGPRDPDRQGPVAGDVVVYCAHVAPAIERGEVAHSHIYSFPPDELLGFLRRDGSEGEARWMFLCEPCHTALQATKAPPKVTGDCIWRPGWKFGLEAVRDRH